MLSFIFGIGERNSEEFLGLFAKAYNQIKAKNLGEAVNIYNNIFERFMQLKERKRKGRLKNDLIILHNEILLYIKMNNAYADAKKGELKLLREKLDRLHDLAYGVDGSKNEISKIENFENNNFEIEIYTRRPSMQDFDNSINEVVGNIAEERIQKALISYIRANIIFTKLMHYLEEEKKAEIYFKMRKIFKQFILNKTAQTVKETKKRARFNSFEDTYQKIQECLKKGDMKTATKLYKYL